MSLDDPRNRQYTNGEITVFWKPSKCIHATTCFRELIEVFNPGRRPWVNMQGAPTQRIIEVVDKCPTQALEWTYNRDLSESEIRNNGELDSVEITPETLTGIDQDIKSVKVEILKDGPIIVKGDFKVIGPQGNEIKSMHMTSFCRCGGSESMPFCDGTHRKIKFSEND